jgi:hypothetical protein
MLNTVLLYVGSFILILWGGAHLVFTKPVVDGFKLKSKDLKRVFLMEWIMEGLALCFIGVLVGVVTLLEGVGNPASVIVYGASIGMLVLMAIVSAFTGARVAFIVYRLCPVIFLASALLFLFGGVL